jgi:hydroxyethylthiazole kinase-like uncharacterized protein yjeF
MTELTADFVKTLLPARLENSSKGSFGSVLVIAGSANYRGAAFLSCAAALRVGTGYVTLAAIPAVVASVSYRLPDAVYVPLKSWRGCIACGEYRRVAPLVRRCTAVAVGPGLSGVAGTMFHKGGTRGVRRFFARLMLILSGMDIPVVLDADGLNFLSELQPLALPRRLVMTPHPKELARLLGTTVEAIQADRAGSAERAARKYGAVVVLKGHRSIVTDGSTTFVNSSGNSALAKAGSGDVLTGVIAGFAAQGLSTLDSARFGVWLHGRAGEIASAEKTDFGVLASDLPDYIPRAILSLSAAP